VYGMVYKPVFITGFKILTSFRIGYKFQTTLETGNIMKSGI